MSKESSSDEAARLLLDKFRHGVIRNIFTHPNLSRTAVVFGSMALYLQGAITRRPDDIDLLFPRESFCGGTSSSQLTLWLDASRNAARRRHAFTLPKTLVADAGKIDVVFDKRVASYTDLT